MNIIFQKISKFFLEDKSDEIKEFCKNFAKLITNSIIKGDTDTLREMSYQSSIVRDEIEFEKNINKSKEYYYGFWFAYENIARNLSKELKLEENVEKNVELVAYKYPRLKEIIRYVGEHKYAYQNEIATNMGIGQNYLWNILNNSIIREANIFKIEKMGRNVIYTLNEHGLDYYNNQFNNEKKVYSGKQIERLIDLLTNNMDDASIGSIVNDLGILNDKLVKEIYTKLSSFKSKIESNKVLYMSLIVNSRRRDNKINIANKRNENTYTDYSYLMDKQVSNY